MKTLLATLATIALLTGWVKSMHSGGQVLQSYKDGKQDGLETYWFEN